VDPVDSQIVNVEITQSELKGNQAQTALKSTKAATVAKKSAT